MSHSSPSNPNPVFFDDYVDDYEDACQQGLRLSGESSGYFVAGRARHTAEWLRRQEVGDGPPICRVADFGCGAGHASPHLRGHFPRASIVGLDVSARSIDRANRLYAGAGFSFEVTSRFRPEGNCDLVYCNGVFHHIPPDERIRWFEFVRALLAPGGYFVFWENNPWNPGTRVVMRRIEFDRDAIPIAPPEARKLLNRAGFSVLGTRFHFYFPRLLAWLRFLEAFAVHVPLGAQYCVLARKPLSKDR